MEKHADLEQGWKKSTHRAPIFSAGPWSCKARNLQNNKCLLPMWDLTLLPLLFMVCEFFGPVSIFFHLHKFESSQQ